MDILNAPEISLWLAFMAGLLGSAHCMGMCGPLVSAFFLSSSQHESSKPVSLGAYHVSRILVYTLVGVLAAALGSAVVATGVVGLWQGVLLVVIGLLVILVGFELLGWLPKSIAVGFVPRAWVQRWMLARQSMGPIKGSALGGAVNGLVPCPLTFALAVKATTAASVWEGGALMLTFGLGTLPSMLFVSALMSWFGQRARVWLMRLAALTVMILGGMTLIRGLEYVHIMQGLVG